MIWFGRPRPELVTKRLRLRPPKRNDYEEWARLRSKSKEFLEPWEPVWARDHLSFGVFLTRVKWARKSINEKQAYPFLIAKKIDNRIVGGITLDKVRKGPSQSGELGYWTGEQFARRGYMTEAIQAVLHFAFHEVGLCRIEAACLPENVASKGLLEKSGFTYEGVARNYLEIAGERKDHVVYSAIRGDRLVKNLTR